MYFYNTNESLMPLGSYNCCLTFLLQFRVWYISWGWMEVIFIKPFTLYVSINFKWTLRWIIKVIDLFYTILMIVWNFVRVILIKHGSSVEKFLTWCFFLNSIKYYVFIVLRCFLVFVSIFPFSQFLQNSILIFNKLTLYVTYNNNYIIT